MDAVVRQLVGSAQPIQGHLCWMGPPVVWATPDSICLSLDWRLVLSGVALCSGLMEGRDPLSPPGKSHPLGFPASGQLGRPLGHGGLESGGGGVGQDHGLLSR